MISQAVRLAVLLLLFPLAHAQANNPPSAPAPVDPLQAEINAAVTEAQAAKQMGPMDVPLIDQAVLKLPQGYVFFPGKQSGRLLRAMGNRIPHDPIGMVVPGEGKQGNWFVVIEYDAAGYVKDDDAKNWNADELLNGIREGNKAANEERRSRGIPESEIVGWVEPPTYDASKHRLVWSIASKQKGAADSTERTINYNTYALGREGYMSLNLVTGFSTIESDKANAKQLLSVLEFNSGKKYENFDSSTDKVAEYGLAALVGGIAAKKLGLFALIAAFAAKFAKVIGLAAIAGGAAFVKFFGGRKARVNTANDTDKQA
jgi:uncharacterized membrane-anchored protein